MKVKTFRNISSAIIIIMLVCMVCFVGASTYNFAFSYQNEMLFIMAIKTQTKCA